MAFTSTFISNANIGDWDYYIFTDNVGIWRAMNGLAAWFGGSGPMLQGAAWLGALIALTMILIGAISKSFKVNSSMLVVWFFFMSTLGIQGKANVYNIYTNQVTVIQNVPALALVPTSVFSKAAYKVFTSMDTAFQGVNGSYMTVSRFGFVGPLEVLLALRSPSTTNVRPALNQTLAQVFKDCAMDPYASGAVTPMSQALDIPAWLVEFGRKSGLTRVYQETDPNTDGMVVPCATAPGDPPIMIGNKPYAGATDYVNQQYESMATGSADLLKAVNAASQRKNPQDANGRWGATSIDDAYDMLVGTAIGVNQTATQFTKNALVASTVTYTMDCLSQSGAITSPDACTAGSLAMADSMEKWKTSGAMAGSGFLKTMFTSMGMLQVLFFALFPIIAVYALAMPHKTGTVFGGFLFFGIWCQSWLLTVAPIQSYIQTNIIEEMTKVLAGHGGMTLANSMAVYEKLSTKLAIAGDIMASSQMLSLALLSGSMYALNGLAQRWSAERHMDTSKLQHDVMRSAPMTDFKPANSVSSIVSSNGNVASLNNKVGAGNYGIGTNSLQTSSQGVSASESNSRDKGRTREQAFANQLSTTFGMSREQAASVSKTLSSVSQFTGSIGTGVAKAIGGAFASAFKTQTGKVLDAKSVEKIETASTQAAGQAVSQLAASDASFVQKLTGKAGTEAQAQAVEKLVETTATMVGAGVVMAEVASGVGAPAAPVTAMAVRGAAVAAAKGLGGMVRSGALNLAKDAATDATVQAITKKPGGVELFAKGIGGDTKALFTATVGEAAKLDTTDKTAKNLNRGKTMSATDADKIVDAYRTTVSEESSRSEGNSQTHGVAIAQDKETMFRSALAAGEQGRKQMSNSARILRQHLSETDHNSIMQKIAVATQGRTPKEFGGGADGQAAWQFEQDALYTHLAGSMVNNSALNTGAGEILQRVVPTQTTPAVAATKGHWEKIPQGKPGAANPNDREASTALRDWAKLTPEQQENAAPKAGMRWVPGTPGSPEVTSMAPRPSDHLVAPPLRQGGAPGSVGGQATAPVPQPAPSNAERAPAPQPPVTGSATPAQTQGSIAVLGSAPPQPVGSSATPAPAATARPFQGSQSPQQIPNGSAPGRSTTPAPAAPTQPITGSPVQQPPSGGAGQVQVRGSVMPKSRTGSPTGDFVPTGGMGVNVGSSPGFPQAAGALIRRGDTDNQRTFDTLQSAEQALDDQAGPAVKAFNDKRETDGTYVAVMGAVGAGANMVGSLAEARRNGGSDSPGRTAPGEGSGQKSAEGAKDVPKDGVKKEREPVNQRTRMGRAGRR